MLVCKQCGVELDSGMQICPLCDTPVIDGRQVIEPSGNADLSDQRAKPRLLRNILWQIVCILLLSGIVSTLIIDVSIVGRVTWSIYPVTICLVVLCYATLLALWKAKFVAQIIIAWIASGAVLLVVQLSTAKEWPLSLAFPIVSSVTIVSILLTLILNSIKMKGLNVLAILFVGIAIVCLIIEGILSLYFKDQIQFSWSVVVSACLLPVTAAIVFIFLRTRNNRDLQKIFHT